MSKSRVQQNSRQLPLLGPQLVKAKATARYSVLDEVKDVMLYRWLHKGQDTRAIAKRFGESRMGVESVIREKVAERIGNGPNGPVLIRKAA